MNWQGHLLTSHWTALGVVPALFCGLVWYARMPQRGRRAIALSFALFAALEIWALGGAAYAQILHPPLWDFKVFWTVGHVAAAGGNIYEPASYLALQPAVNPGNDAEFKIGMVYPPPAILLFFPLGFIASIPLAMTLWYVALLVTIAIAIVLMQCEFFASYGGVGMVAAAVFVLVPVATAETVELAQLNFFALCFVLMFWRRRTGWQAGLWLAPAIVVRPFLALLALELIAQRRWNALLAMAGGLIALLALSAPIVGWSGLGSYVRHDPSRRFPESYFDGFDSLYRILVHVRHDTSGYFSLVRHPDFDALALLLVAASAFVCARAGASGRDASLAALLSIGLFLYPETGSHYTVLLLPAVALLWRDRRRFGFSDAGAGAVLTLHVVASTFSAATGLVCALDGMLFATLAMRRPAAPEPRAALQG